MSGYTVIFLVVWIFVFGFKFETAHFRIYINGLTKTYSFEDKK